MNYNSFFGFSDSPFLDDLDQRFLFLSKQFQLFLAQLTDFVGHRQGIAVVSGDDGVGKTMLGQALVQKLSPSFQPLIITRPATEPLAITQMLAQSLGITLKDRNLVNLRPLADAVQGVAQQGKYFFLVLDDAHVLTDQHLEEIYDLSQMVHQGQQLMPIMLVGRTGLMQKLASQTNQRLQGLIRHNLVLSRLPFEETTQYIDHRLQQVGSSYKACFAEGCSGQLFSRTGGIPRRINQACDQALNRAWQENQSRVTRDLLGGEEPVAVSQYKPLVPLPKYSPLTRFGAWAAAVLLTGLVGYVVYSDYYAIPNVTSPPVADRAASPSETVPAPPQEQSSPAPEIVTQVQPRDLDMEVTAKQKPEPAPLESQDSQEPGPPAPQASQEPVPPESQASPATEPFQVVPRADSAVPPEETQTANETKTGSRPAIHRVDPVDGGLLRIAAGYYPDEQEVGYNAIILANPEINNEDIIYPGQKLSLPEVDKNNKVITLNNDKHFCMYKQYHSLSQVEQATTGLQEQGIRCQVRKTRLPSAGPIYRIFLGGYESTEELQEAMTLAEKH